MITLNLHEYIIEAGLVLPTEQTESLHDTILHLLVEKDKLIQSLSEQVTRYKCEQVKHNKLVKTLQEKLSQLAPSVTNSTSTFMMHSEFKTEFESFMSVSIPNAFGSMLQTPLLYAKLVQQTCKQTYESLNQKLRECLSALCNILNLDPSSNENKLLQIVLKILQQNCHTIFPWCKCSLSWNNCSQEYSEQLNNILQAGQFQEMQQKLHQICLFMLLQEKKWEFVWPQHGQQVLFSKKEHCCIDGWLKEEERAVLILQGLIKNNNLHAGIKKFVIPGYHREEEIDCSGLTLIADKENRLRKLAEQSAISIGSNNKSIYVKKEPSFNIATRQKAQNPSIHIESVCKPHLGNIANSQITSKQENELQEINCSQEFEAKYNLLKEEVALLKRTSMENQISCLLSTQKENCRESRHREILEELPLNREHQKKKVKANTSRKSSVGKIISQNVAGAEHKQNKDTQNRSLKHRQKIYRQLLKEKLQEERNVHEKQSFQLAKPKGDKERRRQENRPLKLIGNIGKLREKYAS